MAASNSSTGQSIAVMPENEQGGFDGPEVAYRVRPRVARRDRDGKPKKPEKLQKLINFLESTNDQKFTGYIKINFTQGAIGRIERFEEILSK